MGEERDKRLPEIEKTVESLESRIRAQIARTQSGARAVLVIGIILIAVIFIYLTWLTAQFRQYSDPKELASMLLATAQPKLDEAIDGLETALTESAESNVDYVLNSLIERLPGLRMRAEQAVAELVDQFADQLDAKVDGLVAEMLEQKKAELDPLIEAAAEEGQAEELEKAFSESLEETFGPEMDRVLVKYDAALRAVDERLDMLLQPDEKLTPEQLLEKEIIATVLIFIDDAVQEQLATPPEPPAAE